MNAKGRAVMRIKKVAGYSFQRFLWRWDLHRRVRF
jgi:hypothetical protein